MKKTIRIICFYWFTTFTTSITAQNSIVSWNIKDFGSSKSDQEIEYIANTIHSFDILAIQEVVAGIGGAQAVARLADQLNRKGTKWDYIVSSPTSSNAYKTERYAFIWKTNKVKLKGKPFLEPFYHNEIDREPFFATFLFAGKEITFANFHAITKTKQPEREIKYFKQLPNLYPEKILIFMGDFNCPQSHTVFNPLKKMNYSAVFINQKTSLKNKCNATTCLASEFDNIFYPNDKLKVTQAGIIAFYTQFQSLQEARLISDHVPIWVSFR